MAPAHACAGSDASSFRRAAEKLGVTQDGIIGAQTLAATRAMGDPAGIVTAYSDRRLAYYRSLRHWSTFGNGWTRRTRETAAAALDMARRQPARVPSGGGDTAKAPEPDELAKLRDQMARIAAIIQEN